MLSLDKATSRAELEQWMQRCRNRLGADDITFTCEPKIDGVAVALIYEHGELTLAATRGDGNEGENILPTCAPLVQSRSHCKTVGLVSLLCRQRSRFEARSIFPLSTLEAFNAQALARGDKPMVNPRNGAAGSLRQLDSKVTARRPLTMYCYSLGATQGEWQPVTQDEVLNTFAMWGLRTNPALEVVGNLDACLRYILRLEAKGTSLATKLMEW